jgi:hypothetical protein
MRGEMSSRLLQVFIYFPSFVPCKIVSCEKIAGDRTLGYPHMLFAARAIEIATKTKGPL